MILPCPQVGAAGVPPAQVLLHGYGRVVLIEQVDPTVPLDEAVGVVHPAPRGSEVQGRTGPGGLVQRAGRATLQVRGLDHAPLRDRSPAISGTAFRLV